MITVLSTCNADYRSCQERLGAPLITEEMETAVEPLNAGEGVDHAASSTPMVRVLDTSADSSWSLRK